MEEFLAYNYDVCMGEKLEPWLDFDDSPPLDEPAPDFPLTKLDDDQLAHLKEIWRKAAHTIIEFGSF